MEGRYLLIQAQRGPVRGRERQAPLVSASGSPAGGQRSDKIANALCKKTDDFALLNLNIFIAIYVLGGVYNPPVFD